MQWMLYTLGIYVSACYFGGLYMVGRVWLGARPPARAQRRLTRLLPGRAVARTRLPQPVQRSAAAPQPMTAMRAA